MIYVRDYLL